MKSIAEHKCEQKKKFFTRELAELHAESWRRDHKGAKRLYPYKCSVCTYWHLTKRKP